MDQLTLHNALVHLPLGLSIGAALLAVALLLAIWRNWLPARSLALLVLVEALVLAGGIAAFRTGEAAEDRAERRAGKAAIHRHEERAEAFLWVTGGGLLLSGAALAMRRPQWSRWGAAAAAAGALAGAGAGFWTGKAGGAIAHPAGNAAAVDRVADQDDD
ncbi:MAG TPA: hypothetical protein VFA79_21525 [Myxococcales bacterium]|nr:hypothetical protein [Myxococcales bacterium]